MIILVVLFLLIIILYCLYSYFIKLNYKPYYKYKNELLIGNNFYSQNDFDRLGTLLKSVKLKNDLRISSRKTRCLQYKDYKEIYRIIYNKNIFKKVQTLLSGYPPLKQIPDFPAEYRLYSSGSIGMHWHKDSSLFAPDCLEIILTIENTSDMKFLWKENGVIKSAVPRPNSLIIVKPGTVLHAVSPSTRGTRTILKYIVQLEHSEPTNLFYDEISLCPG